VQLRSKRSRFLARSMILATMVVFIAGPAFATYPDWEKYVDVEVIEILTTDEDGEVRETKVWFVLLSDVPYLRTNDSRWLHNLRRNPDCGLRIEGTEYRARGREIPGDEIVAKVDTASALKYGWQETLIHPFRMNTPEIIELLAVPGDE
jgi:hypothetical protein